MSVDGIEVLKKAIFLHDLGKVLNWAGALHLLDGARVLKRLGFEDTVVGVALYHEGKYVAEIERIIEGADCAGLKPCREYDRYSVVLGQLVDQLMAGFDRLGEGRKKPIALRNPLTHLPLNGLLYQFEDTIDRSGCVGTDARFLREFVRTHYLPGAGLKRLDVEGRRCVYAVEEELKRTPLLQALGEHADSRADFNALYRALSEDDGWRGVTRRWIPQGHTPPTDTLALWYHMQLSSAMAGLYWAEGFRGADKVEAELGDLRKRPLKVKIGLLYVRIGGLREYFRTAYRLPDFSGSEAIGEALKETVRERLLEARRGGEAIVWEDSFLYRGRDDFLVMVPVERTDGPEVGYTYRVAEGDPFLRVIEEALGPDAVLDGAVRRLLSRSKVRRVLSVGPDDEAAFGDGGELLKNLKRLVSVEWEMRCFAAFKDGSELTPWFGVVWNRLRAEVEARLREGGGGVRYYAGDVCDCCRVNLAGHDPDPGKAREWAEVDWERGIIRDEEWAGRPLRYWVFRGSDAAVRGEGDKLCHACLLRRILGQGVSLEKIAREGKEEARIAMIKGNVNRTVWYVGGSTGTSAALDNRESVYSHAWRELAERVSGLSMGGKEGGSPEQAIERLEGQAAWAFGDAGECRRTAIGPGEIGGQEFEESVTLADMDAFLDAPSDANPFRALCLRGNLFYVASGGQFRKMDARGREEYGQARDDAGLVAAWHGEARELVGKARANVVERQMGILGADHPNPWAPYPVVGPLEDVLEVLFAGSPNFCRELVASGDHDVPTPSRTMTVSWLIDRAVREVYGLVDEEVGDVVYAGGNEFLVVCRVEEAPEVARRIFRRVVGCLNSVPEDRVEALSDVLPVTLAMGMVVAKRKHPMYGLLELADRLVWSSKAAHANGDAIDFENVVGGVDEGYLDREKYRAEWLSGRPLTLAQFGRLVEDVGRLRGTDFPQRQLQQVAAVMRRVGVGAVASGEPHASRRTAALGYVLQQEGGEGWEVVQRACEEGCFQDLWTLYRMPHGEEG